MSTNPALVAQPIFQHNYDGGANESGTALHKIDDFTDIFLCTGIADPGGDSAILLTKITEDGDVQWAKTYNTYQGSRDVAYDIEIDDNYNVMVVGETGFGQYKSAYFIHMDTAGTVNYSGEFGMTGTQDAFYAVAEADSGFICAGHTEIFGPGSVHKDVALVYLPHNSGSPVIFSKGVGGMFDDEAFGLIRDNAGDYVAVGYTESSGAGGKDIYVIKFDDAGNKIWSRNFGGQGEDIAYAVTEDLNGYLVTGSTNSYHANGAKEVFVLSVSTAGAFNAMRVFSSPNEAYTGTQITYDFGGGIAVSGNAETSDEPFLLALDDNLDLLWMFQYDGKTFADIHGAIGSGFFALGENADTSGFTTDLYVAAIDDKGNTSRNCSDLEINPSDSVVQPVNFATSDTVQDIQYLMQAPANDTSYVLGPVDLCPVQCTANFFYTLGLDPEILFFDNSTTLEGNIVAWEWDFGDGATDTVQNPSHTYTQNGVYEVCLEITTDSGCVSEFCDSITIMNVSIAPGFPGTSFVFPNPAVDEVFTEIALKAPADVRLELYDLQGRKLRTVHPGRMQRGKIRLDLRGIPSGLLLLRISAGKRSITHKLMHTE